MKVFFDTNVYVAEALLQLVIGPAVGDEGSQFV